MMNLLINSMNDPIILEEEIYDQQSAINYLDNLTRKAKMEGDFSEIKNNQTRVSFLYDTLYENFIPHVGRDFSKKSYYLGYMTNQLIKFYLGLEQETNRDNFINKIDLSGFLLASSLEMLLENWFVVFLLILVIYILEFILSLVVRILLIL